MPDAPGALPLSCGKAHCGAIGLCKARGVMRDGALASLFNRPLRETTRRTGPRQTSVHYKLRTVAHNLPRPLPLGHVIVKKPQGWTVYLAPPPSADALAHRRLSHPPAHAKLRRTRTIRCIGRKSSKSRSRRDISTRCDAERGWSPARTAMPARSRSVIATQQGPLLAEEFKLRPTRPPRSSR